MSCDALKSVSSNLVINPYVYCANNPVSYSDPTGLQREPRGTGPGLDGGSGQGTNSGTTMDMMTDVSNGIISVSTMVSMMTNNWGGMGINYGSSTNIIVKNSLAQQVSGRSPNQALGNQNHLNDGVLHVVDSETRKNTSKSELVATLTSEEVGICLPFESMDKIQQVNCWPTYADVPTRRGENWEDRIRSGGDGKL